MFVTLFFAVYDVRTGELAYSSGGHPPPYIVRAGGGVEPLPQTAGAGLGVSSRIAFGSGTARLECGDGLLLYTDGVTEAMDAKGGMFGEERLVAALSGAGSQDGAAHMMAAVRTAVDGFAAGAEQYDDITMVGFRRDGDARQLLGEEGERLLARADDREELGEAGDLEHVVDERLHGAEHDAPVVLLEELEHGEKHAQPGARDVLVVAEVGDQRGAPRRRAAR